MDTNRITERCKQHLQDHYGNPLVGLILYGSMARSEAGPDSDIDLLVLLDQSFYFGELRIIVELLHPVQIESEYLISARPAATHEFEAGCLQLYHNAKREGLRL